MNFYLALKLVHILCAIIAVGANLSYGLWLGLSKMNPQHTIFILKGVKKLDDWIANPAYFGSLITGHILIFVADIPFSTTWVWLGEALFVLQGIIALPFYTPLLKRQIAVGEAEGLDSPLYQTLERRAFVIGMTLNVLALAIVAVMVLKPA
jgi:uncharacterized membrane protein